MSGRAHLPGDGHDGHAVQVGVGDGGDQVVAPGPEVAMHTPTLPDARA